ncbi:hypothetical protein HDU96_009140 [Phlyctochytrium bullatum]|nr:hypothetical protein HDU96_009140 [Phlyctochytrium bullatum]
MGTTTSSKQRTKQLTFSSLHATPSSPATTTTTMRHFNRLKPPSSSHHHHSTTSSTSASQPQHHPKPSANSLSKTSYARISRLVSTVVHCMDMGLSPWAATAVPGTPGSFTAVSGHSSTTATPHAASATSTHSNPSSSSPYFAAAGGHSPSFIPLPQHSSNNAYPSPSSPAQHPGSPYHPPAPNTSPGTTSTTYLSTPSSAPLQPSVVWGPQGPPPKPSAALYAFAHRLLSSAKLSLPVVLVALKFLDRYFAVARRGDAMALPWDMVLCEGLLVQGRLRVPGVGVGRPPVVADDASSMATDAEAGGSILAHMFGTAQGLPEPPPAVPNASPLAVKVMAPLPRGQPGVGRLPDGSVVGAEELVSAVAAAKAVGLEMAERERESRERERQRSDGGGSAGGAAAAARIAELGGGVVLPPGKRSVRDYGGQPHHAGHPSSQPPPQQPQQPMNPFALLIAALMSSNKFLDDARYSNKWWSKVSEMSLDEVNHSERRFLDALGYGLAVSPVEYDAWVERMQRFARMIEESERHGEISPSVSPNMPPPLNPAVPVPVQMQQQQQQQQQQLAAAAAAAALAQQRSPRSPYQPNAHLRVAGSGAGSAMPSPMNPTWVMAGPPPPGSALASPAMLGGGVGSSPAGTPSRVSPMVVPSIHVPGHPGYPLAQASSTSSLDRPPMSAASTATGTTHVSNASSFFQQQEALLQILESSSSTSTASNPAAAAAMDGQPTLPILPPASKEDPRLLHHLCELHPPLAPVLLQNPGLDLPTALVASGMDAQQVVAALQLQQQFYAYQAAAAANGGAGPAAAAAAAAAMVQQQRVAAMAMAMAALQQRNAAAAAAGGTGQGPQAAAAQQQQAMAALAQMKISGGGAKDAAGGTPPKARAVMQGLGMLGGAVTAPGIGQHQGPHGASQGDDAMDCRD